MRGKTSSSKSRNAEPESGAYIRSLVKQLSSSRTRDPSNLKQHETKSRIILPQEPDKPRQRKKQVRRRLHTSRPYQERLLNMAEARREIVTALKYHRASMKQAREKQQAESRPVGPASYCRISPGFCAPHIQENLNVILPSQALGLNLNLQDFNYPDSTAFRSSSIYSSSPSTSFVGPPNAEVADSGLHPVMDDEEMSKIRSLGEQYQMEWNDTLSLMNSAWWFEFLKAMEISPEDRKGEKSLNFSFEEALEFPAWMNANENDFCSDDYVRDPALPCMDIEEIDGMDGDWLA